MYRRLTRHHTHLVLLWGLLLIVLSACNLGTPKATPAPTPDIPTVDILSPPNNAQVIEDTNFDIDIIGRDNGAGVSKIELYVDGTLINEKSSDTGALPQYRVTMNWLAQGVGLHVVSAVSYREDGRQSDEAIINIEVIARQP